jgi:glycosyltransferase involved in cell wall biosynthesis
MAGGGVAKREPGRVTATDGTVVEGDIEHIGSVTGLKRRAIFMRAEVFICPTLYIGPWEGVHAEAMMSGVGVVAPDYGVFTETLPREYRYHNLKEAVRAVESAQATRGHQWRNRAIDLCSTKVCTGMYDDWLDRIESLSDGRNGWYG